MSVTPIYNGHAS